MNRAPTRNDRARDIGAAVLMFCGAALYGYSFLGMRAVSRLETQGQRNAMLDSTESAVSRTDYYWMYSRAGIALFVIGLMVAGWAAWRHHRTKQTGVA
ncbi:MAG: hypothetical protein ABR543_08710 [Gemmatimonadaceae bacterium]